MKPTVRFEVFKRDNFTCRYCGRRTPEAILEIDHICPLSAGGTDDLENLATSCYECNRGKAARLLTDVPPESDLHEKAVLIAEQERQAAELAYWRAKQREREDKELDALEARWFERWADSQGYAYWQRPSVRRFLRQLGYGEVEDILEYVNAVARPWGSRSHRESAWAYFVSVCARKARELRGDPGRDG